MRNTFDIAVVGAGIVGVSTALWLQRDGHKVALVDRTEPGMGTSFGNAGVFATYGVVPINSPSLPARLPQLLFARETPLRIDWRHLPQMTPWLLRFLANCTPARVERIVKGLASLVHHAEDGAMPLFRAAGADRLMHARGALYLYDSQTSFNAAADEIALRRAHGVDVETLDPHEVGQLEPNIARIFAKALFFPSTHHYVSPSGAVTAMADHFAANGGTVITRNIGEIRQSADRTLELHSDGETIRCKQAVLSAGAFSKRLFGRLVEPLPLGTERGYHVVFPGFEDMVNRPVGWAAGGFYLTPMSHGLRAAGTVELGDLSDRQRRGNIDHLVRNARKLLPGLPHDPAGTWVGHRPTMPDSLPVIGRSARTPEIILAFGHQHMGMTLGGITGKLVSQIVAGSDPEIDLTPFSPHRF